MDQFLEEDVPGLERFDRRFLILLIDLGDDLERVKAVQARIPAHLTDRVFVLGVLSEPEKLRQAGLGSFEEIGQQLARECRDGIGAAWNHELLGHNIGELERLRTRVGPLLWGP